MGDDWDDEPDDGCGSDALACPECSLCICCEGHQEGCSKYEEPA